MCIVVSQNLPVGLAFRSTVILAAWFQMVQGQRAGGKELVLFDQKYMQAWPSPQMFVSKETKLAWPWGLQPVAPSSRHSER